MDIMEKLKGYTGEKVKCTFVSNGFLRTIEGTLTNIEDYESITIDGQRITFIGVGMGIVNISCGDEMLFENPYMTTNYMGFGAEYTTIARKVFGKPWIRLHEESLAKFDHSYKDYNVSEDWYIMPSRTDEEIITYYEKYKKAYIIQGRNYVAGEPQQEDWKQMCEYAAGNRRKIEILNAAYAIMRFLKEYDAPIEEILRTVKEELQLSDELLNDAVHVAVTCTGELGREMLMFWAKSGHRLPSAESSSGGRH